MTTQPPAPRPQIPNALLLAMKCPGAPRIAAYVAEYGTDAARLKAYHIEKAVGLNRRTVARALAELLHLGAVVAEDTGSGLTVYYLPGPALLCAAYTNPPNGSGSFEHPIHKPLSDFEHGVHKSSDQSEQIERAVHKGDGSDWVPDAQTLPGTADATRGRDKGTDTKNSLDHRHDAREGRGGGAPDDDDDSFTISVYLRVTGRATATLRDVAHAPRLRPIPRDRRESWMREVAGRAAAPVGSLAYFVKAFESERAATSGASDAGAASVTPTAGSGSARDRLFRHASRYLTQFSAIHGRDPLPAEMREHLAEYAAERGIDPALLDALYPPPSAPARTRPRLVAPVEVPPGPVVVDLDDHGVPVDAETRGRLVREQIAAMRHGRPAEPQGVAK